MKTEMDIPTALKLTENLSKFSEIIRWGMEDMEQIVYPWGIYETAEIEAIYIDPYLDAIKKVLSWSGEMTYR